MSEVEVKETAVEKTVYEIIAAFLDVEYAGEDKAEYMKQLAQLLSGSSDERWAELEEAAKDWYNAFAAAYAENEDTADWMPPEMDGLDAAIAAYVPSEKPAKAAKGTKAAKAPKAAKEPKPPKAAKEPKPPKPVKEPTDSNSGKMREKLAEAYDMTLDELMAALEANVDEKGNPKPVTAKRSSVHIVWFNTQRILETIVKKGSFKNKAGETFTISKG